MMKRITIFILVGTLFFSCSQNNKTKKEGSNAQLEAKSSKAQNFDWLIGQWKRNNEEDGKETFENWKKIGKTEYSGIGFTMQNGDTVSKEEIKIVNSNGKWDLIVKAPDEIKPITFKIIKMDADKFVCTNDTLDFPNRIEYSKNGEKINAVVSGNDMEIPFEFERLE